MRISFPSLPPNMAFSGQPARSIVGWINTSWRKGGLVIYRIGRTQREGISLLLVLYEIYNDVEERDDDINTDLRREGNVYNDSGALCHLFCGRVNLLQDWRSTSLEHEHHEQGFFTEHQLAILAGIDHVCDELLDLYGPCCEDATQLSDSRFDQHRVYSYDVGILPGLS